MMICKRFFLFGTAIAIWSVMLVGCGRIAIESVDGYDSGVVYFLPRTTLAITATQKYLPKGWVPITAGHFFKWIGSQPSPTPEQQKADQSVKLKFESQVFEPKGPDVPDGVTLLQMSGSDSKNASYFAWFETEKTVEYSISTTPAISADKNQRYVLKHQPSPLFHERLCIGRNPETSLLVNVEYAAEDRTPQILFNVIRSATAIFTRPASLSAAEPLIASDDPRKDNPATRSVARTIDPFRLEYDQKGDLFNPDIAELNAEMTRAFGERIYLDMTDALSILIGPVVHKVADECGKDYQCRKKRLDALAHERCDEDKICYRSKVRVPIKLRNERDHHRLVAVEEREVVNQYDIGSVDVTRGFLIQKVTRLLFQDGVLVGVALRKPSEVEAASLLPVSAIVAVLSTPVGLLSNLFAGNLQTQLELAKQLGAQQQAITSFRDAQAASPFTANTGQAVDDKLFQIRCSDGSRNSLTLSAQN